MKAITVPGVLDSLSLIAELIKSASAEAQLSKKAAYNLRLAVDEIATNIIMYGYEDANIEGTIDVHVSMDDDALTVTMEDTGVTYDPFQSLSKEEETVDRSLSDRPIGGLGILLTVQGVDQFIYERSGDRNRNIFKVYRTPLPESP
ncbi:MAG: ATP-binding protein [Synechococcaceae cyanobacterium SM2_3_2]|nr:ATP-binding protein [Synechococcaceae cyanobacterium SM2_3_2]